MTPTRTTTKPGAAVTVACIALFTDMLVYGLAIPVLPLLEATVDAGPTGTGALFASYAAAMIVVTPLAGRMVDRRGPRGPLLIGLVGLAAATVLFAIGGPFWLLLLGRVLQGIAAGMSWVASLALISAVIPFPQRGKYLGMAMSMIALGTLIGPPLSGLLVEHFGTPSPFIVAAAIALADGVLRIVFIKQIPMSGDDPTGPLAVLRVRGSVAVIGIVALGASLVAMIQPVLPQQLSDLSGADALDIGLLFGLMVVVGIVLNPLVGALVGKIDARYLVALGILLAAGGTALLGLGTELWQVAIALAVIGAAIAFFSAPPSTLIGVQGMQTSPPALGGAYSLYNLAYAAGLMLGPLLAGLLVDVTGFPTALAILATGLLVLGAACLPTLPNALATGASIVDSKRAGQTGDVRRSWA
ncbi:MAG: transporter, family, solute carrier family 18 (vesicular amine transporter), er 1/2 [Actinomycetota bacterium]|nr:transporter, family, solute carrier family 18 (vesicular amine transporter), er 1/2 [Actinomycetota bacterium]